MRTTNRTPAAFSLHASLAFATLTVAASYALAQEKVFPWDARPPECFGTSALAQAGSLDPRCRAPAWTDFAHTRWNFDGLLADPDYDLIERAANELGFSEKRFPSGEYHFEALYLSMVGTFQYTGPHGARIAREWTAAKGPDGYSKLAQALVYYGRAWNMRGGRAPHTISPEAWELFYSNLELANGALDSASDKLKRTGPWHALKLNVAFDHPKYASERLNLVKAASAAWPDYLAVYTIPMEKLSPKNGGSFDLVEGAARYAFSLTKGSYGAGIYALAYERVFRTGNSYTIADSAVDWPLMKQGMRDLEGRSDVPPTLWRSFAQLACQKRDAAETRRLYALYDNRRTTSVAPDSDACRSFTNPDPVKSSGGTRS